MIFELNEEQISQFNEWKKEQYKKAVEQQKKDYKDNDPFYETAKMCWEDGYPYEGAIGGGFIFTFTPTSIGLITTVEYILTKEKIDLTDYKAW